MESRVSRGKDLKKLKNLKMENNYETLSLLILERLGNMPIDRDPIRFQDVLKCLPGWMMKHDAVNGIEFVNMQGYGFDSFKNEYFSVSGDDMRNQSEHIYKKLIKILQK